LNDQPGKLLQNFYPLFIYLTMSFPACAQETGCFKPNYSGGVDLETTIDLGKYNAFFVGESHGVYGTIEIKLALIKYLNIHYGISDVFLEISYSSAWLYNQYLQTGDTSLFTTPALAYAMKQANRDFWKNLYEYNKSTTHKITIHGMDFERMDFLRVLKLLMPRGKEIPQGIAPVLSYVDTIRIDNVNGDIWDEGHPALHFNRIYDSVKRDIAAHKHVYEQYYGDHFKIVEQIMFNENTYRKYGYRNKTMYDNMMKEISDDTIKKFIAFAGLNHGNSSRNGMGSLCYRLTKTRAFKSRFADMAMVCKNCYDWQLKPPYRQAAFRAPETYLHDEDALNNLFEQYYSPSCKYTLLPASTVAGNKVRKFSAYIILMKDQPEFQ
jgi:hypothetical protein